MRCVNPTALKLEIVLSVLAVAGSLLLQLNAIAHHGFMGQDFAHHRAIISEAVNEWRLVFDSLRIDPPLYYLLAAWIYEAFGGRLAFVALLTVLLNIVAIIAFVTIGVRFQHRLVRLALLFILCFLPVRLIHSTVIATDALTIPLFVVLVILLDDERYRARTLLTPLSASMVALILAGGIFVKYSFAPLIVAVLVVMIRRAMLSPGRRFARLALALLTVLPATVVLIVLIANDQNSSVGFMRTQFRASGASADMNVTDVIVPKLEDLALLDAPGYAAGAEPSEVACGSDSQVGVPSSSLNVSKFELLASHRYSYFGLLHLSTFTDILNIFQNDPCDTYFGTRTAQNQFLMMLAVRASLIVAVLSLIGVLWTTVRWLSSLRSGRSLGNVPEALLLCSVAWLGAIAIGLTQVGGPYVGGYWLARLVMPALIGFIAIGFVTLDSWLQPHSQRGPAIVVGVSVGLSALYASFLIP